MQAEAAAARHRETAASKQARIAELEERARLFGDSVKQSAQAKVLERKWLRFLLVHGDKYGFQESRGPSVELVKHFATYCFCTRDRASAIGREGMGDSFELQIRYMLAKFVFVSIGYKGWKGLSEHALHKKAEPFKMAVCEQWKRLKRSDPDGMSTLKPFVKTKWCDTAYFLAQDHCMEHFEDGKLHPLVFVSRMATMAFSRATCSRAGSACKDWFDRAGRVLQWLERNVLSVKDLVWAREGMELEMPDGSFEVDPLRSEVHLNRVKHYYLEMGYEYEMSVTADAVEPARRANTWLFVYCMCRGLFKVQYTGMSDVAVASALRDRADNGFAGGMPAGATISLAEAERRWEAGEKAYLPQLEDEPLFVKLQGRRGNGGGRFVFTNEEMSTQWYGSVFSEIGDELGFRPHASGLNSIRRNAMVGVQKGAERAGFDTAMHAKKISQHRGDGQACREKVYEDSTATTDIGAFLMGRTPQRLEKLRSLAMTRVPELAKFRTFSDVAEDDSLRVELLDADEQRLAVEAAVEKYAKVVDDEDSTLAERSEAAAKAAELSAELGSITRRLQRYVLEQKRQQVYANGQRKLLELSGEDFRARKAVKDLGALTRVEIITKFAVGASRRARSMYVDDGQEHSAELVSRSPAEVAAARAQQSAEREQRCAARRMARSRSLSDDEGVVEQSAASSAAADAFQIEDVGGELTVVAAQVGSEAEVVVGIEPGSMAEAEVGVETGTVVELAVVMAPPSGGVRAQKRQAEDELLVQFEAQAGRQGMSRARFAAEVAGVPVGTLDGMLSRARKRRRGNAVEA